MAFHCDGSGGAGEGVFSYVKLRKQLSGLENVTRASTNSDEL